jgi:hypothetical protein
MEAMRQMLGAVFIALGEAAGPEVLAEACGTITHAVETGAVDDPYARAALRTLVRACEPSAISSLAAAISRSMDDLSPETPVDDVLAIIRLVDTLESALDRLAMAVAPPPVTLISTVAAVEA